MCNCDSGEDATDDGVNPYAQLLPVTGLFLGGTTKSSSIEVEIGPLICNRRGISTIRKQLDNLGEDRFVLSQFRFSASFEAVTFSDRNARITGVRTLSSRTFDLWLQAKFAHSQMSLFTWESADSLHWLHLYIQGTHVQLKQFCCFFSTPMNCQSLCHGLELFVEYTSMILKSTKPLKMKTICL